LRGRILPVSRPEGRGGSSATERRGLALCFGDTSPPSWRTRKRAWRAHTASISRSAHPGIPLDPLVLAPGIGVGRGMALVSATCPAERGTASFARAMGDAAWALGRAYQPGGSSRLVKPSEGPGGGFGSQSVIQAGRIGRPSQADGWCNTLRRAQGCIAPTTP
jgi:hypothetical protein